ncbi:MAG: hypothetical protein VYA30_04915 [Myxococcota bacterium]|nr:hypothetical protein [Myxococcota bacterium]
MSVVFVACDSDGDAQSSESSTDEGFRAIPDFESDQDMGTADSSGLDMDVTDVGPSSGLCDRMVGYGFRAPPSDVNESPSHSPRAVWTGTEWGVTWISAAGGDGPAPVWFQRFNGMGLGLGQPVQVGQTDSALASVIYTGESFAVAFVNGRTDSDPFAGIVVRAIGPDGQPAVTLVKLESTFDVQAMSFVWAPFAGGMLVYSRGRGGNGGAYSIAFDGRFTPSSPVRLTDSFVSSVAVTYGDGGWGTAFLEQVAGGERELVFTTLDENGGLLDELDRIGAGGVGPVSVAYGQGSFAIAWTRIADTATPKPVLTLVEAGGDVIGTLPVEGPMSLTLTHDIEWFGQQGFAVAWLAQTEAGKTQAGITRVSALGVSSFPFILPLPDGASHSSVRVAGLYGNLGVFYTLDSEAPAVGFSSQSRSLFGRATGCN